MAEQLQRGTGAGSRRQGRQAALPSGEAHGMPEQRPAYTCTHTHAGPSHPMLTSCAAAAAAVGEVPASSCLPPRSLPLSLQGRGVGSGRYAASMI